MNTRRGRDESAAKLDCNAGRDGPPLSGYGDHQIKLYGRLATRAGRAVNVFEAGIQGPNPYYSKTVAVLPGSYRWIVTVKDVATGGVAGDTIDFEVK